MQGRVLVDLLCVMQKLFSDVKLDWISSDHGLDNKMFVFSLMVTIAWHHGQSSR